MARMDAREFPAPNPHRVVSQGVKHGLLDLGRSPDPQRHPRGHEPRGVIELVEIMREYHGGYALTQAMVQHACAAVMNDECIAAEMARIRDEPVLLEVRRVIHHASGCAALREVEHDCRLAGRDRTQ